MGRLPAVARYAATHRHQHTLEYLVLAAGGPRPPPHANDGPRCLLEPPADPESGTAGSSGIDSGADQGAAETSAAAGSHAAARSRWEVAAAAAGVKAAFAEAADVDGTVSG